MQHLADRAVRELSGIHFDIPDPIKKIECCIAPTHDGAIYYTDPTEDFSRPGPHVVGGAAGIDAFSTWKEVTTVFHEGVPGHHLQIGQNAYRTDLLNRWQRKLCFCSGHSEGWALYAERLMDEPRLPGRRRSDGHARRSGLPSHPGDHRHRHAPAAADTAEQPWEFRAGERWTPAAGFEFLSTNCSSDEPTLARTRPLSRLARSGTRTRWVSGSGWRPERSARRRKGPSFNLRQFHADALNLGALGLDPLRRARANLTLGGGRVRLILASASPARLRTLRAAGLAPRGHRFGYRRDPPERRPGARRAAELARRKAEAVSDRMRRSRLRTVIVGCDSMLELNGRGYGKPETADAAVKRWQMMSGRSACYTGHHVILRETGRTAVRTAVAATTVHFAELSSAEIQPTSAPASRLRSPVPSPSTVWVALTSPGSKVTTTTSSASACRCCDRPGRPRLGMAEPVGRPLKSC